MRRAIMIVAFAAACAKPMPPAGPKYTPNPTPEPVTKCPDEYKAAKAAREALVGETAPELREAAAKASFAHGECERKQFDELSLDADSDDEFREGVASLKAQAYTTQNLYQESANYDVPLYAVGGYTRMGDLYAAYAKKLRNTQPGAASDPQLRAMWFQDLDEIASKVDSDGAAFWEKALDIAEMGPEAFLAEQQVASWTAAACTGLHAVDPGLAAKHKICNP
jgi:hypothetical protein